MYSNTHTLKIFAACLILTHAPTAYAQTTSTISSISFGDFDFALTYNGNIQLGTNNTLNVTGSGISYNGGATRGHLRVTSPATGIIQIKCTAFAEMVSSGASNLAINELEIAITTGVAFGSGNECAGIGGGDAIAASVDLDANPNPDIYIGGEIDITTPINLPASHNYTTAGTGTPLILSVIVQ